MLPSLESDIPDTMQAGELERGPPEEAPPHASMTVTRDSPQTHSILSPPLIATNASEYKFKHDNDATDTTTSSDVEADLSDGDNTIRRPPSCKPFPTTQQPTSGRFLPHQPPTLDITPGMTEHQTNESVRSWLQRITAMQQEIQKKQKVGNLNPGVGSNIGGFQQQQQPTRVVKYQDLPYMGEMTLDNSKPRRGRKPKKADICHLIYKNYGTIFPGTPKNIMDAQNDVKKILPKPQKDPTHEPVQRTNVQNRIISSLLEKRLTQESLRNKELLLNCSTAKIIQNDSSSTKNATDQNEPLNLCIRDLNQLKIRLLRKHGNVYASDSVPNEVKSEPVSDDDDVEFVDESPSPEVARIPKISPAISDIDGSNAVSEVKGSGGDMTAPGGYVYWPNAGVFIHPMALHSHLMYYQRLTGNTYTLPGDNVAPPSSPVDTPSTNNKELRKLIPKMHPQTSRHSNQDNNQQSSPVPPEETYGETGIVAGNSGDARPKRGASHTGNAPTKRKRSAIFIPPIPTENQTNPATEVSICKFKFTGGAKPSLQEKKMLSVDSGGNFRYYSGTGDKSMRGYEFFPRETLQQQAAAASSHGSGTGAFLQASGEKLPMLPPPGDQKNLPPDFMFSGDPPLQPLASLSPDLASMSTNRHRKRKTRKSLQREKLEQTFKEKGFLIQTQQLESAEGATYCKFRQLRKFTRYLFRSWKDYLPGSVRELHETERTDEEDGLESAAAASVIVAANAAAEKDNVSERRRTSDLASV